MIKVIIVDDEHHVRKHIESICAKLFSDEIIIQASCATVDEAVYSINTHKPDLVFLDISIQNKNGFEVVEKTKNFVDCEIVFVTAHEEYAIKAFEASALHYILKPITEEQILEVVNRYKKINYNISKIDKLSIFIEHLSGGTGANQRVVVPNQNGFEVFSANAITYIKADGAYSEIYSLNTNKATVCSKSLKMFQDILDPKVFHKCHRSYLVNINYVKSYDRTEGVIYMIDGTEIPLSIRSKKEFANAFL